MDERALKRAVDQGARLLDLKRPGWARCIDLQSVYLGDPEQCILGQLYGHFYLGAMRVAWSVDRPPLEDMTECGFTIHAKALRESAMEFARLTGLWKEEVMKRNPGRTAEVQHGSN